MRKVNSLLKYGNESIHFLRWFPLSIIWPKNKRKPGSGKWLPTLTSFYFSTFLHHVGQLFQPAAGGPYVIRVKFKNGPQGYNYNFGI